MCVHTVTGCSKYIIQTLNFKNVVFRSLFERFPTSGLPSGLSEQTPHISVKKLVYCKADQTKTVNNFLVSF